MSERFPVADVADELATKEEIRQVRHRLALLASASNEHIKAVQRVNLLTLVPTLRGALVSLFRQQQEATRLVLLLAKSVGGPPQ